MPRQPRTALAVVQLVIWAGSALLTAAVALLWALVMRKSESAIQEAAASAGAAAVLIVVYSLSRAADKVVGAVGALVGQRG